MGHYSFQAKGSGKSGAIFVSQPGPEILPRTACTRTDKELIVRFEVGFPANGRTINARELEKILFSYLPASAKDALMYPNIAPAPLNRVLELADDQEAIRAWLRGHSYAAFVADGSVLPRKSGVSSAPMAGCVPFSSPESMRVSLDLPHKGHITGMGIPQGITLITGGGYHGKSTLLKALEAGVYAHIPGDGREYVITDETGIKLRSEDGRSIKNVDISPFIDRLPGGRDTHAFSTEDASGSTSQAAGVIEGLEAGASLFLIDEDTCATNFMVRDELMQKVIHPDKEPITPFINRVRDLWENRRVSTIMVAGSSGTYFHVADHILQMDHYHAYDITETAKTAARDYPFAIPAMEPLSYAQGKRRITPAKESPARERPSFGNDRGRSRRPSADDRPVKIKVQGRDQLFYGKELIDLRYVEQLVDTEQTKALGYFLAWLVDHPSARPLTEQIGQAYALVQKNGLAALGNPSCPPFLALPRIQEVFACCNRCRSLRL